MDNNDGWIAEAVEIVIEHLNKFGACVMDNFLGEKNGLKILDEVLELQKLTVLQVLITFTIFVSQCIYYFRKVN